MVRNLFCAVIYDLWSARESQANIADMHLTRDIAHCNALLAQRLSVESVIANPHANDAVVRQLSIMFDY